MSNVGKRYILKLNLRQIQAIIDSLEQNAEVVHHYAIDKKKDKAGAQLRNVGRTILKQLRKQSNEWTGLAHLFPHERETP